MSRSESSDLRIRGAKAIQSFIDYTDDLHRKGLPVKGNEPKMGKRTLRSVLLTPGRYNEILEQALTENWSPEKLKNKIRSMMEREFPKTQRVLETDRIHHASAPDMWTSVINRAANAGRFDLVVDAVDAAHREGLKLGDTEESTSGASFDERAHTGARPKVSKTKFVAPAIYGPDGVKELSAHPRGTKADSLLIIPDRSYDSAKDLVDEARPRIRLANEDTLKGIKADSSRRAFINDASIKAGVIPAGSDVFRKGAPAKEVQAVTKLFRNNKNLSIGAAEAYSPNGFANAGLIDKAGTLIKNNWKGEALGAGLSLLSRENRQNIKSGNYRAAVRNVVKDAAIGGVTQAAGKAVLSVLPKAVGGAVGAVAAPLAAGAIAYQALDTIVDMSTGRNIQETGQDAERMKAIRRQSGWSEHDLRRHARTGYKPPTPTSKPVSKPKPNTENCKINRRGRKVCK